MPSPFAITTTVNKVKSEKTKSAKVPFTVTNQWDGSQRGRARIVPEPPAVPDWFSMEGEAERDFENKGSIQQYVVQVSPDAKATSGSYAFRFDMIWVEDPEQNYTQGPSVAVEIPEQAKRKLPSWLPWAVGAAVLVIMIAAALLLFGGKQTVPDVAGLSLEQAIIRLQDDNLRIGEPQQTDLCASDLGPVGARTVIASTPAAGASVKNRGFVQLVYASGQAPVPEVSGMPADSAKETLTAAGFQVSEEDRDSTQPQGTVIDASPPAGEMRACGQTVVLHVSNGLVAIPPVRGDPAVSALQKITAAGFTSWGTAYEPDKEVAPEHAIRTDPADRAATSQTITVFISSGPPKVPVPPVGGLAPDQATQKLTEAGFTVMGTQEEGSGDVPAGQVIGTEPKEGTEVVQSEGLVLLVSSGPVLGEPPKPDFYTLTLNVVPDGIAGLSDQAKKINVPADTETTVEVIQTYNGCTCHFFVCQGTSYLFAGWAINGVTSGVTDPSIPVLMNDDKVVLAQYKSVDCGNIIDPRFRDPFIPKLPPNVVNP